MDTQAPSNASMSEPWTAQKGLPYKILSRRIQGIYILDGEWGLGPRGKPTFWKHLCD